MKISLLSILIISLAFGQSENATMTIYKNGYALVKQPVDWSIRNTPGEVEYSVLPEGIKESSPYLNLQSGQVINQKLDGNLFSESILIKESLGDYATITTIDDEDEYGTLIAISPDGYTIQTRRDVIFLKKEQVKKVTLRKVVENPKFRPSLRWKISSNDYHVTGDLVYMSRGFDWDAVYRMVVSDYWGTPSKIDKFLGFDEYVNRYLDNCVDFVCDETNVDKVSIQGYCTGGTLATVYSALHPERVKNLIATAPVIDGWKDTTVVSNIAKYFDADKLVDTVGNMPPEFIYFCFSILKPFEQGVEKYIKFLNNIDNEKYVDSFLKIEKWLDETPPIPGELFRQWIKGIYQDNLLIQNKMYVGNKHVSLKNLNMPVFTQVAVGDHLVSPECSMPLHYAVSSTDKILKLYPTGHVGMIASSFSQKTVLPELGQYNHPFHQRLY